METRPRGSKRRTRQGLTVAFIAGLISSVGLAACSSSTSSANPFAGKTPGQVLALSKAALLAKGSVHVVEDDNFSGATQHIVSDAGTSQGKQVITSSTGNLTILLVSAQMAFIQGDSTYFEQTFNLPQDEATKYAGQWIAVPSSSSSYAPLVTFLTVSSVMTGETPSAPLRLTKPTTIDGKSVVGVSGGLGQYEPSGFHGTQVLYISAVAPYLPVSVVYHETNGNGKTITATDHVSDYGESVSVTTPANSIPISSIPGAS